MNPTGTLPVGYRLVDGDARHTAHPATFWMPARAERDALQVGEYAKLAFEGTDGAGMHAERMWVQVTGRTDTGWRGTLANDPVVLTALDYGDLVAFSAEHVLDILKEGQS